MITGNFADMLLIPLIIVCWLGGMFTHWAAHRLRRTIREEEAEDLKVLECEAVALLHQWVQLEEERMFTPANAADDGSLIKRYQDTLNHMREIGRSQA